MIFNDGGELSWTGFREGTEGTPKPGQLWKSYLMAISETNSSPHSKTEAEKNNHSPPEKKFAKK